MNKKHKDLILSYIEDDLILAILKKYCINTELFIKDFVIIFLQCFYEKREIYDLSSFVKNNQVQIDDFFIICNRFKNKIIEFEKNSDKLKQEDIDLLFENIFSKLLLDFTNKQSKEILEQKKFIIEQSKFTSMGEMLSVIVHQWRQPLQTISILVQKISLTKMIDKELQDEFIDKVTKDVSLQINYMSKTMDDFRDFFKPNKEKSAIKCSQLIDKTKEFLNYMFEIDDIFLEVNIKKDVKLSVCSNDIVQVLINIIKNARDEMIEKKVVNRKITLTCDADEKFAIIKIEDNANGIKNDIVHKIFDPYFSTKKEKGTGLGLYICKKIIEEAYFGKLDFKNGDFGAIFEIKLPLN